jgi:hypothetical protein
MLDIRTPIGALFLILGGLLTTYGLMTPASVYAISLGYNLNLLWGGVMVLFGAAMLGWQALERPAVQAEVSPATRDLDDRRAS